jgi:hypothetical protein
VAWQLVTQAVVCRSMGSPFSAHLLDVAAADVLAGGPVAELLVPAARPGRDDAAALRFLAALHRLVLERRAPALALHFATVGGTPDPRTVPPVLLATVAGAQEALRELVALPCQTNEVGRSAGLVVGHLAVAAATGLPLRLLEVGASAGLHLRFDHYAYRVPTPDGGSRLLGPDDADVVLDALADPLPGEPTDLPRVAERSGCDLAPVDTTTLEGRTRLSSSIWTDQPERFARLGAAMRTAADVPAVVERASAADWVQRQLADAVPGVVSVVHHAVVEEYLSSDERAALHTAVEEAGARATAQAPVAHVRFEPAGAQREVVVDVRVWPAAPERVAVASCDAHGRVVRIPAPARPR